MKTKQLWTLLIILAVLGAGTFLRQTQKPAKLSLQENIPLNLSFTEDQIKKIIIERTWEEHEGVKPSQKVELIKKNQGWELPGFFNARVNSQKVTEFFRQIRDAQGEQRTKGKQFFRDFEIGDTGSFRVTLYSENQKPSLEFFLGLKTASGSYFIRKKDSDAVYLTQTNFFAQMGIYGEPGKDNLFPEKWAATDFLAVDSGKVRSIEIKIWGNKGRETVKAGLEIKDGKWHYENSSLKGAVSDQKVKDFLSGMATWTAEKVLPQGAKDFSKPLWQMTVFFNSGESKTFKAADKDEKTGAIYFQVSGDGAAYQVSKYYFDNMDKDDAYFAEDKPAAAVSSASSAKK